MEVGSVSSVMLIFFSVYFLNIFSCVILPFPGPLPKESRLVSIFTSLLFTGVSRLLTFSPSSLGYTRQKENAENSPKCCYLDPEVSHPSAFFSSAFSLLRLFYI